MCLVIQTRLRTNWSRVEASDEADLDDLRNVNVPPGLNIEIMDLDM